MITDHRNFPVHFQMLQIRISKRRNVQRSKRISLTDHHRFTIDEGRSFRLQKIFEDPTNRKGKQQRRPKLPLSTR